MDSRRDTRYSIRDVRRQFFVAGDVSAAAPQEIIRSWRRCVDNGLAESERLQFDPLSATDLELRCERNRLLLAAAEPEIDALYEQVIDRGATVILTDPDGLILQSRGCAEFLKKAERVALRPGAFWTEQSKGTNAIGTAIAERKAVQVHGAEHFLSRLHHLTCSATPIVDPYGELAGILDISGDARAEPMHDPSLLILASQYIEHRMFGQRFDQSLVLRCHTRAEYLGSPREGVLVFDDDRLVAANRNGLVFVGSDYAALGNVVFDQLFDTTIGVALALCHSTTGLPGKLRTRSGKWLFSCLRRGVGAATAPKRHARAPRPGPPAAEAQGTAHAPTAMLFDTRSARQLEKAVRVVDAGMQVTVLGETGVGKEVFARRLHELSQQRDGPFIALNCAAVPETLIESELFGYEEGAFTGARRRGMPGKLRQAEGGTLFLDEVGDMPLAMQARLLRVLQQREVTPLGGGRPYTVSIAIVCATHRELESMIADGTFRADLFYRLNHFIVRLPALRERDDLPALVDHIMAMTGATERGIRLAPAARQRLLDRCWPGNVRQLDTVVRTLVVLAGDGEEIGVESLPEEIQSSARTPDEPAIAAQGLAEIELATIREALTQCRGNVKQAAQMLGINRSTIYRKLQRAHSLRDV